MNYCSKGRHSTCTASCMLLAPQNVAITLTTYVSLPVGHELLPLDVAVHGGVRTWTCRKKYKPLVSRKVHNTGTVLGNIVERPCTPYISGGMCPWSARGVAAPPPDRTRPGVVCGRRQLKCEKRRTLSCDCTHKYSIYSNTAMDALTRWKRGLHTSLQ